MPEDSLVYTPDVERGHWVHERLGDGMTIASVMPRGFEAYARVLHPVEAQLLRWDGDTPVTEERLQLSWRDVAERCGTMWHPLVQWSGIIAGHENPGFREAGWQFGDPRQGELPMRDLAAISRILAGHTTTPQSAFIAIPDGTSRWKRNRMLRQARTIAPAGLPPEVIDGPRLELPGRAYLLFEGSVRAFEDPGWAERSWGEAGTLFGQTPNQLWPNDRAWFLASEIDFDSTIIAGTRPLVDDLIACRDIEVVEIPVDASLAHDADTINPSGSR